MNNTTDKHSNKYGISCPGCGHFYIDQLIDGVMRLIHPGYRFGETAPKLPSSQCIASYDYVVFTDCRHCCPEAVEICPECQDGRVTTNRCSG